MKLRHTFFALVTVAALAAVGMYPADVFDWFSQTFGLADGASFTGQGATGGEWSPAISEGAATVWTVNGRKCIDVDSTKIDSGEIQFVATNALSSIVRMDFSIGAVPLVRPPSLTSADKGGLCLLSTNQVGVLGFAGYTANGWTNLVGRGFVQHNEEWLDCRAEFDYSTADKPYVTYYQDCGGGQYTPLVDTNGVSRFPAASAAKVTTLVFRGSGYVGEFSGTGVQKNDSRSISWDNGATGDDWDDPENWNERRVPADGDVAVVYNKDDDVSITRTVGSDGYAITASAGVRHEFMSADGGASLRIAGGDVELLGTISGTVVCEDALTLFASGTFGRLEMAFGSTLKIDPDNILTVTGGPLLLDGIGLDVDWDSLPNVEAFVMVKAPYGSGGTPLSLTQQGSPLDGWTAQWHGNLDGSATLWLVNGEFEADTARWNDGAWGNLVNKDNWGTVKPSSAHAAWMGSGKAYVNDGDSFAFARRFEIGTATNALGEITMRGGTIAGGGSGASVIGANGGAGLLDIVGGTVRIGDYLWNSALTVGCGTNAAGTVRVGVESSASSRLLATGGGISVGEGGAASLEIGKKGMHVGEVAASGPVAVGYVGELAVTGGRLVGENAFYIGRAAREEAYDVTMTVTDGAVSNLTAGAFWVGSYGGLGSQAAMTILGGEVYATNLFVCGGYRSASVTVAGGSLVAPEVRIGHALIDDGDYASFNLVSGRVTTAGFTSGATGVRTVSLAGGRVVATATNDDFFAGIDVVRLDGDAVFENDSNVVIRSALTGPGGLFKTGTGKTTVTGYVAWAGSTVVEQGALDMAGGMVMGELSVAEGASIDHAKFDDIDALELQYARDWDDGTTTTSPYLLVQFGIVVSEANSASVIDDSGIKQGAISFVSQDDGDALAFAGWTALGWTRLGFRDGSTPTNESYVVQMKFDFTEGKPYVVYYADGGNGYERLVSDDGLTVFPVAGGLNAKTFVGVGDVEKSEGWSVWGWQMNVDDSKVFYWTGAEDNAWTNGNNWAGGKCPKDVDVTAYFPKAADVQLSQDCCVGSLVVNAPVTLSGAWLSVWKGISGVGTLTLDGATISGQGAPTDVRAALNARAGTENEIAGSGVAIYGTILGAGDISTAAKIYGDTSGFAGKLSLVDGGIYSDRAACNALSSWSVANSLFAVGDTTYEFGSLNGSFSAAEGVRLVVGAKDSDCSLDGAFAERSGLEWSAKQATLAFSVMHADYLVLSGGGKVALGSADAIPASVSFVGNGGVLSLAAGVDADVSAVLVDSTAPVAFDDGGSDFVWSSALSASNEGGFVKRGAGTLKWLKASEAAMDVTVEEGVLEIPAGTALGFVNVFDAARIVVDTSAISSGGVVFSATGANRKLDDGCLQFDPPVPGLNVVYGENNSIVVVNDSGSFVWTGDAQDGLWTSPGNWQVGGIAATRPPQTNDTVVFQSLACTTVRLDVAACVMQASGFGSLHLCGSGTLRTLLSVDFSNGKVGLDGGVIECGGDLDVLSVYGSGRISVAGNSLTVSPAADCVDAFSGALDVTNLVKRGQGDFRYVPTSAFGGVLSVERGKFIWDCAEHGLTNQLSAIVKMKAGTNPDTVLDLDGQTVTVASFTGSGTVNNGVIKTADGIVTQSGGSLEIPIVAYTTYYASRSDEKLQLVPNDEEIADASVVIVIPRIWFAAGASGRRAIRCESRNIMWTIARAGVKPVSEVDGEQVWWSISGGGFAVRLR